MVVSGCRRTRPPISSSAFWSGPGYFPTSFTTTPPFITQSTC